MVDSFPPKLTVPSTICIEGVSAMRLFRALLLFVFITSSIFIPVLYAQENATDAQAIRAVMDKQVTDWNRGDLDAFATGYKNSPDILFIGSKISRGYAQMLDAYRKGYSTKEKMGTLSFTELEVQSLDASFSTVTGNFHLERTSDGGGNADGYFLLVFEKTPAGWKIVRDDSTNLPRKASK
jgi:ketosteroid isomerase-like protein